MDQKALDDDMPGVHEAKFTPGQLLNILIENAGDLSEYWRRISSKPDIRACVGIIQILV
jgi:hypothetical protein